MTNSASPPAPNRTWRHLALGALGIAGLLLAAALLSDGTAGGDEGGVLSFLSYFDHGGWQAIMDRFSDDAYVAHRLFWLLEKIGWNAIANFLLPTQLRQLPIADTFVLVLDGPLFMVTAFAVTVLHLLRRGHAWTIAVLAPSCVLVASSGISLFTGGFIECAMCLLVALLMSLLDRTRPLSAAAFGAVVLSAALLVFAKLYAAPFVFLLALLLRARRQRTFYIAAIVAAPFAWLMLQSFVRGGGGGEGNMMDFYTRLMTVLSPASLAREAVATLLSFPFGLLPCFPLLLAAFFCGPDQRRTLVVKIVGVCAVMIILLPFGFWYGPGGMGGPRYIVPFLLIFVPEIAAGLSRLAGRRHTRPLLLAIPMLGMLFLPVLEYRNSLIGYYGNRVTDVTQIAWPHGDPAMHPAVFAWRVLWAKSRGLPVLTPSRDLDITLPVAEIFPMTGISRVIYLLGRPKARPMEAHAVRSLLPDQLLHNAAAWQTLRMLLALGMLGTLGWAAAFPAGRKS